MQVKFQGMTEAGELKAQGVYEVLSIEFGWYRIKNESGEDALYPSRMFSIVTRYPEPPKVG